MQSEELLLDKLRTAVELQLGWGEGRTWSNQDFIELSEQVFLKTKVNLSSSTLKRVWGKVNYGSKPSTTTLDTLSKFSGYESWRDFKVKSSCEVHAPIASAPKKKLRNHLLTLPAILLSTLIIICIFLYSRKREINPNGYRFSSKTVVSSGVPNSVIFDFDASKSPIDSVIIQQSWNPELQTSVAKNQKQHTSIYYYPNHFRAKLIVGDRIVKEHDLLIRSDGWLPLIEQKPAPVYLPLTEVKKDGRLEITESSVSSRNINMSPLPPTVMLTNVQDFGEIYTDEFVFEASMRNTYYKGSGACQTSSIFLYCIGGIIKIPLLTKGCVSEANIMFTDFYADGKKEDLSAFGVDFQKWVDVRIESAKGKANLFVNNKRAYTIHNHITKTKIVGISFRFAGLGAVNFVKLSNGKYEFKDGF